MTIKFTGHVEISDLAEPTGFVHYLLVSIDGGGRAEAYGFADDTLMDIDEMLREVFGDFEVETCQPMGGANYAAIILDGRTPDTCIVWQSRDFYLSDPN